ncbi:MAG: protogloblin ApPgb [Gemmatimonas sp.]|nr:protogloblin ApPgb [Gemmatimonas sp.]
MAEHESRPNGPTVSLADFELMKTTALFGDEDVRSLRASLPILKDQTDAILDVWYDFVGSNSHLLYYFTSVSDRQPIPEYLDRVRERFEQWILDTAAAQYDQHWLDYQLEIGRRHHRSGKNRTDRVDAIDHIPYRYLPPLVVPITTTLRPFLEKKGHALDEVDKMHAAWVKSVILQVTLWSLPYCVEGDF